jgi:hypothetical protein
MAKEQNNHQRNSVDTGDGRVTGELEQLRGSYEAFRQMHQPRMRIPEELRKATLEAIGKGVPEKSVREMCRITPEQLNRWRELQWGRRQGGKKAKARVFNVVDTPADKRKKQNQSGEGLELRIGQWEISIRQKVE